MWTFIGYRQQKRRWIWLPQQEIRCRPNRTHQRPSHIILSTVYRHATGEPAVTYCYIAAVSASPLSHTHSHGRTDTYTQKYMRDYYMDKFFRILSFYFLSFHFSGCSIGFALPAHARSPARSVSVHSATGTADTRDIRQ